MKMRMKADLHLNILHLCDVMVEDALHEGDQFGTLEGKGCKGAGSEVTLDGDKSEDDARSESRYLGVNHRTVPSRAQM